MKNKTRKTTIAIKQSRVLGTDPVLRHSFGLIRTILSVTLMLGSEANIFRIGFFT